MIRHVAILPFNTIHLSQEYNEHTRSKHALPWYFLLLPTAPPIALLLSSPFTLSSPTGAGLTIRNLWCKDKNPDKYVIVWSNM